MDNQKETYIVGSNGDFASVQEALDASWVATQGNNVVITVLPEAKLCKEAE